jgi:hypothetical protein
VPTSEIGLERKRPPTEAGLANSRRDFFTLTPGWCNTIRFRCFSNRLPVRPSCTRCRFCSGLRFCTLTNKCQQIGCILPRVCFLTEGLIRNHRRNCR